MAEVLSDCLQLSGLHLLLIFTYKDEIKEAYAKDIPYIAISSIHGGISFWSAQVEQLVPNLNEGIQCRNIVEK